MEGNTVLLAQQRELLPVKTIRAMSLESRNGYAVMHQGLLKAALVEAHVMGHQVLPGHIVLQCRPHLIKRQGTGRHSGRNAVDLRVEGIELIAWRAHQHADLVDYLATHHAHQPHLADGAAAAGGSLKVNGGKGVPGHNVGSKERPFWANRGRKVEVKG